MDSNQEWQLPEIGNFYDFRTQIKKTSQLSTHQPSPDDIERIRTRYRECLDSLGISEDQINKACSPMSDRTEENALASIERTLPCEIYEFMPDAPGTSATSLDEPVFAPEPNRFASLSDEEQVRFVIDGIAKKFSKSNADAQIHRNLWKTIRLCHAVEKQNKDFVSILDSMNVKRPSGK